MYTNIADKRAKDKRWQQTHPQAMRSINLKSRYGITLEEYQQIFKNQCGLCAICRLPSSKTLHVDHDHVTGKIRGLLCIRCNVKLGILESPEWCEKANQYLNSIEAKI